MIVDVAGAAAALQAADDILILTHRRPDGDTAGCAGALCRGLQQIGKRAYILENPEITRRYAPLIVPYYPPEDFVPAYVVRPILLRKSCFRTRPSRTRARSIWSLTITARMTASAKKSHPAGCRRLCRGAVRCADGARC